MKRVLLVLLASAALAVSPARAQQAQTSPATPPSPEAPEDNVVRHAETVSVVDKGDSAIIDAPLAVSLIRADTIMIAPSQNYGDLLRSVPGINIIQPRGGGSG